jgi:hypothetical protein
VAHQAWQAAHLVHRVTERRQVFDAISVLTTMKSPTFVWRGHVSSSWTLAPAVHRKAGVRSQNDVIEDQSTLLNNARLRRHDIADGWRMPDLA